MAELVVEVQAQPEANGFEDGDVLCAFTDHRIGVTHAEHICFPRDITGKKPVTEHGFRHDPLGLAETMLNQSYEFRFERISLTEVKRVTLATGDELILPPTESFNLRHFIARRLATAKDPSRHVGKILLGSPGQEKWWGGRFTQSTAEQDAVWSDIETKTPLRRSGHRLWPLSPRERRRFLSLSVDDFSQEEGHLLTRSEKREIRRTFTVDRVTDRAGEHIYQIRINRRLDSLAIKMKVGDLIEHADWRAKVVELTSGRNVRVRCRAQRPTVGSVEMIGHRHSRKRRRRVPWRALALSRTEQDIDNRGVEIDVRDFMNPMLRATLVQTKAVTADEDL